uniref:Putative terminase n=1 Tax=viral metagenome TaxID=1070528 RepID=A0A6M3LTM9_9ZZZZ
MANKLNARQKLFCINMASGMSQADAYTNAGYHSEIPGPQATELLHTNTSIQAYLNRLIESKRQLTIQKSAEIVSKALSKEEKRGILADIARAQLTDMIDDAGNIRLDKKSPAARALKEWYKKHRLDKYGNPIVTSSVKLIDPITAIMEDNKMSGDYAPSKHMLASYNVNVKIEPKKRHGVEDTDATE